LRLAVRPGITGWAQVNGGTSLLPTEKEALDIWYISNASLWLDLRIIWMTVLVLLSGERRSEKALAEAQRSKDEKVHHAERDFRHTAACRFAAVEPPRDDPAGVSTIESH
jgi:lipopolysaccharide/colanic/teichoic acid biosynthesis glycosyltransferase